MSSGPQERTDFEELKEILKEFMYHLDFAYNYRLQKLVYYGDIWCLQNYGKRLTDASFMPYHHGSYSEDVVDALEELEEEGELEYEEKIKADGVTKEYSGRSEGGDLSPAKKEVIKQIMEETAGMKTEQLAHFTKQSWLFKNTEEGEPMDFEHYAEEVVFTDPEVGEITEPAGEPIEDEELEELLPA